MDAQTHLQPIDILLVEDNPGDVRLTMEALKEAKIENRLFVVEDGVDAMKFLHKEGEYNTNSRPDLILLDLNLPKKDGREVLKEIKEDPKLRITPVVVLTTSSAEEDIINAYNHHANCYITKPLSSERFFNVLNSIESFWAGIATLPPK